MSRVGIAVLLAFLSVSEGQEPAVPTNLHVTAVDVPPLPSFTIEPSTNTWFFAATAWSAGIQSEYSNEVGLTNVFTNNPITTVVLAWDPSPGTNVITNYSALWGSAPRTYSNSVPVGTNLTATINVIPPPPPYVVVTKVSTTGTNLYGSPGPNGPWSSLGTTNFVATNLVGTIFFRGRGKKGNTVSINATTQ